MIIIGFLFVLIIFFIYLVFKKFERYKNVNIDNDFYIKPDIIIGGLEEKKINTSNICVFERNGNNNEITDIECIKADELLSSLNLPKERKKMVCIDNNCLNAEDLKILNGNKKFKLTSQSDDVNFNNKCLGDNKKIKLRRCGYNIYDNDYEKINSLTPVSCSDENSIFFKLKSGDNSDRNLTRDKFTNIPTLPTPKKITFIEGHIIS